MHHTKDFSKYSTRKKMWLIAALIGKFAVFGAIFAGLIFLLKNYISPVVLLVLAHVILFTCVIVFLVIHKHKFGGHDHDIENI